MPKARHPMVFVTFPNSHSSYPDCLSMKKSVKRVGIFGVLDRYHLPIGGSFLVTTTGSRRAESRNSPKWFLASPYPYCPDSQSQTVKTAWLFCCSQLAQHPDPWWQRMFNQLSGLCGRIFPSAASVFPGAGPRHELPVQPPCLLHLPPCVVRPAF